MFRDSATFPTHFIPNETSVMVFYAQVVIKTFIKRWFQCQEKHFDKETT